MRIPGSDFRTHNGHPAAIIRHDSDGHFRWAIVECFQPLVKNPNKFGARDPDFSHAPLPAITDLAQITASPEPPGRLINIRIRDPVRMARLPARRSRPMTIEKERAHYNAGRVSCWPFLPCRLIPTALAGARRQISRLHGTKYEAPA